MKRIGAGRAGRRRAWIALALLATAAPAGLAHAQSPPPVYEIPRPPATTPQPGGTARPALMRPFPTVRTAGSFTRRRTRFKRVTVKAPAGTAVSARCRRARCTQRRTIGRSGFVRLRRLERSFKPRTVIEIRISAEAVIGKYVEIRTRRGKPPRRRDRCLPPGAADPAPCPSS